MKKAYIKVSCERGEIIRNIKKGDFISNKKNASWNKTAIVIKTSTVFGPAIKVELVVDDKAIQTLMPRESEGISVMASVLRISVGTLIIKWVGDRKD
jgi:hypothetical protein